MKKVIEKLIDKLVKNSKAYRNGYEQGLKEAWELVGKLDNEERDGGLDAATYVKCFGEGVSFGYIQKHYTAKEVLEKVGSC